MSHITTYLKNKFDPLTASGEEIFIQDIAHSLHLLCRANGHFPHFYSVAQHSVNCAEEAIARGCSERVQLGCLLHDASEAYMSDVTRPLKKLLPDYLRAEERLQNVIFDKWITPPLTKDEKDMIFEIDDAIFYHEFLSLMNKKMFAEEPCLKSTPDFGLKSFNTVKNSFLKLFSVLTNPKKVFIGADWMKGKWVVCELYGSVASYKTFKTVEEICSQYENAAEILIDIPIGLPENKEEVLSRPDKTARSYLKNAKRKSSIFSVPFRQFVYAETPDELKHFYSKFGVKLSKQAECILPAIKQADSFLQKNPQWKTKLVESHPECAFQALNKCNGIETSKHSPEGIKQRSDILSEYVINVREILKEVKKSEREDILDALCLAVTSKIGYISIPETPVCDKKGLPMRIVVADVRE